MRLLITLFLVLLLTAAVAHLALTEPGYVLLSYGKTSLELPLIDFLLGLFLLFMALYALLRLWHGITHAPQNLGKLRQQKRSSQSRHNLMQGLIEFSEGKWQQAEQHLANSAPRSDAPLLNYLAAAHAAQRQDAIDRRDDYLRAAIKHNPRAEVAVGLVKAELQLRHKEHEGSLATLKHLQDRDPKHPFVKKLLARQYKTLGEWANLQALIPELRKYHCLPADEINQLERQALEKLLESEQDLQTCKALWKNVSKPLKTDPQLLVRYCQRLNDSGEADLAEPLLRQALNQHWDDCLVTLYGRLKARDTHTLLTQLDEWIHQQPKNVALLNAAATQNARVQIWGKARSLLQESLHIKPTAEAYQALGNLHEQLQETPEAKAAYQAGFALLMRQRLQQPPC